MKSKMLYIPNPMESENHHRAAFVVDLPVTEPFTLAVFEENLKKSYESLKVQLDKERGVENALVR